MALVGSCRAMGDLTFVLWQTGVFNVTFKDLYSVVVWDVLANEIWIGTLTLPLLTILGPRFIEWEEGIPALILRMAVIPFIGVQCNILDSSLLQYIAADMILAEMLKIVMGETVKWLPPTRLTQLCTLAW